MERISYFLRGTLGGNLLSAIYTANFLLGLHLFIVLYVNSTYLSTFVSESFVGVVYIVGSIGGLLALLLVSRVLKHFGSVRTILGLTFVEFLLFLGLAFPGHPIIAVILFCIYFALYPLILYTLDIFLEGLTKEEGSTGSVRGIFLTTTNTALVVSPLIAGFALGDGQYWRIFLLSAFFLIPFIIIIYFRFKDIEDPEYHPLYIKPIFSCLSQNKPLFLIFKAHFIMRLFFVWMIIYTPIYLHQHIGFEWPTIGVIFTIMLIPYLLFELPAGKIADGWLGEKELLSLGFVVTAISVGLMSFITTPNFVLWATILFMTRVGASLLESMTETYFFRNVDEDDSNTISAFRMLRPLSYIIGSFLGVVTLFFVDIQHMFLILAVFILFGLRYSLTLKDSK